MAGSPPPLAPPIPSPPHQRGHEPGHEVLLRGPQLLFAIAADQPELTSEQLRRLQVSRAANNDWTLNLEPSSVLLRPFADIRDEVYQTYWKVRA